MNQMTHTIERKIKERRILNKFNNSRMIEKKTPRTNETKKKKCAELIDDIYENNNLAISNVIQFRIEINEKRTKEELIALDNSKNCCDHRPFVERIQYDVALSRQWQEGKSKHLYSGYSRVNDSIPRKNNDDVFLTHPDAISNQLHMSLSSGNQSLFYGIMLS